MASGKGMGVTPLRPTDELPELAVVEKASKDQITVRLPRRDLEELDAYVSALSAQHPGGMFSRGSVARWVIAQWAAQQRKGQP